LTLGATTLTRSEFERQLVALTATATPPWPHIQPGILSFTDSGAGQG
jgi:hypothetical protein